jgi:hypothetical protein
MSLLCRSWARLGSCALALVAGCATQSVSSDRGARAPLQQERTESAVREAQQEPVTMNAERGAIDRDDAEEAIARHFDRLKRCYEAAGPAMGYAAGPVKLRFDVGVDGHTRGVNVIESRLGNFAVESCLMETAAAVRFPRPHGGARATCEYSMEFRSTEERAVVDLPEEAAAPVQSAILSRLAADCGAQGLGDAAPAATVYIDRRGQVLSAGFAALTALSADSTGCALASLQRAPLPLHGTPLGNGLSRVTVTITGESLVAAASAAKASTPSRKNRLASGRRQRQPRR